MMSGTFLVLISVLCTIPFPETAAAGIANPASNENGDQAASVALVADRVDHVGAPESAATREPMIVEHPNGTLFVSGYGSPDGTPPQTVPRLWKSLDHGKTWTAVSVGAEVQGATGNSDVSLAIAQDGTLYFATMTFDLKTFEGTQISVGVSQDVGNSWHWTLLSKKRFDDRPWVAVAPDGTAHVIWNDGSGVYHSVSRDRGFKWTEPQKIHSLGGSSHLAIGPNGDISVRITPASASGNRFDEGARSNRCKHRWRINVAGTTAAGQARLGASCLSGSDPALGRTSCLGCNWLSLSTVDRHQRRLASTF
jgi:hypothetical protein